MEEQETQKRDWKERITGMSNGKKAVLIFLVMAVYVVLLVLQYLNR